MVPAELDAREEVAEVEADAVLLVLAGDVLGVTVVVARLEAETHRSHVNRAVDQLDLMDS